MAIKFIGQSLVLVVALVVIGSHAKTLRQFQNITLEDILSSKYTPARYSGRWISDNELETEENGNIYKFNVDTSVQSLELNGSLFEAYPPGKSLSFSPDRRFVLITYNVKPKWRYSKVANYDIYDTLTGATEQIKVDDDPKLDLFQWSKTGNRFTYVHQNDIYYRESAITGTDFVRVTIDGSDSGDKIIYNGIADWVYEEEMLASSSAHWLHPQTHALAFVKFDDTEVESFQYPMYGEPGESTYPEWIGIRYPKAGSTNPTATLYFVADLDDPQPLEATYVPVLPENRHYIATVKWRNAGTAVVIHLNRDQNHATYYVCTVNNAVCTFIFEETAVDAWIDAVYSLVIKSDGQSLLTLMSVEVEEGVTYKQIVSIDLISGEKEAVTKEKFAVSSILSWDEASNKVYFAATGKDPSPRPSSTHIYSVVLENLPAPPVDLTATLTNFDGIPCQANAASFSTGFTNWIHSCAGPGIPETHIRSSLGPYTSKHTAEDNANLVAILADVVLPKAIDITIPVPDKYFSINVRLYVPGDLDEEANTQYPLLIDVYGGPGSQSISDAFRIDWGTSLVSDKKVIYGMIDGRGSGGQTQEIVNSVYRRLGTVEVEDQIYATKWLINTLKYIDGNHTGIWGWSYGGYASALALATDTENVFKCAMSVAPVTSWRYYDTIYTERFMGRPDNDNEAGYNEGQVTTKEEGFRDKEFLLVHGNADDNVHYQQSMILTRALEKADIIFDQLSYPDEAHGISGTRNHLYHSFEHFLFRSCLKPEVEDAPEKGSSSRPGTLTGLTLTSLLAIWCRHLF